MMNEDTSNTTAQAAQAAVAEDVTGKRIVAAIIDIVVLAVVFFVFAALFGDSESSSGDEGASFNVNLSGGPAIIYFIVVLAYYIVLEAMTGKTVGKMLMGLRVVAIDGVYTPGKAVLRNVLRVVDGLPFLYLLGLIVMVSSKRKQRLGDMAAGTLVVRA
jgi:uncharacterized RDD family membrane protein YckC